VSLAKLTMHCYSTYGLEISSELPLPELLPSAGGTDARVRLGQVGNVPPEARGRNGYARAEIGSATLYWQNVGTYHINDGQEITIEAAGGVEARVLRLFLLGPALAVLLSQRGLLVLHASAVAVDGRAVGFLGESGQGKSTTAAAFHRRGHAVVADDVVAVRLEEGCPIVYPGYPQLKLWPEAAAALGETVEGLAPLRPELPKRGHDVRHRFVGKRLPLAALYVLGEGPALQIDPLKPSEAVIELVRHTYAARFLQSLGAPAHLQQCAGLAHRVRARRLLRPRSLDQLTGLVQRVKADLGLPAEHCTQAGSASH
jgi:hypothetical protein